MKVFTRLDHSLRDHIVDKAKLRFNLLQIPVIDLLGLLDRLKLVSSFICRGFDVRSCGPLAARMLLLLLGQFVTIAFRFLKYGDGVLR